MSTRAYIFALLCLAAVGMAGCRRNIVRAAPPSVASPPPPTASQPQPTVPATTAEATPAEPPTLVPVPAAQPTVKPTQPRPRPPAEPEPPKPKAEPEPTPPPQIAPQLSARQLADAQRRTTADIVTAEKNLQLATGKQLNATQTDLVDKIKAFLNQSHDAVHASDWVRAENLAHKAQILSGELAKSL